MDFVAALLCACIAVLPTVAAGESCLELVGQWAHGPPSTVDLHGTTAYLGSGAMLQVADYSTAGNPELLGELNLPGVVEDIVVVENHAYVAAGRSGLRIIDVTDPSHLLEISALELDELVPVNELAVHAGRAYLATSYTMVIVDITDPIQPTVLGTWESAYLLVTLAIDGHLALLADGEHHELIVIDVQDPGAPIEIARWGSGVTDVELDGATAYVARSSHSFDLLDLSDPTSPNLTGSLEVEGNALVVKLAAPLAFLHTQHLDTRLLRIVDVSDRHAPALLAQLDHAFTDLAADGGLAVSARSRDFAELDISNPELPMEVGQLTAVGHAWNVRVSGSLGLVHFYRGPLRLFDLSDPANPRMLSAIPVEPTNYGWWGFSFSARHVFITGAGKVLVYDLGDPERPLHITTLEISDASSSVVSGNLLLVRTTHGFTIFDISNPASPFELGSYTVDDPSPYGNTGPIAVSAGLAFMTYHESDPGGMPMASYLAVIDISDPSDPAEIGRCNDAGWQRGIAAVAGSRVFLRGIEAGMEMVDVSDPTAPFVVWSGSAVGIGAVEFQVEGKRAYMVYDDYWYPGRLTAIHFPQPLSEIGHVETVGDARSVAVNRSYAIVADGRAGLSVFGNCREPVRRGRGGRNQP